jgi:hypothetical protein
MFVELKCNTFLTYDDIVATLLNAGFLVKNYSDSYVIRCNIDLVRQYLDKCKKKGYPTIKPNNLRWSPFFAKTLMTPITPAIQ